MREPHGVRNRNGDLERKGSTEQRRGSSADRGWLEEKGHNSGSTTAGPPLPHVSAIAIASQARGEEANDNGDDNGRATTSYFTAWQDGNATKHRTTVRKRNHGWQSPKDMWLSRVLHAID